MSEIIERIMASASCCFSVSMPRPVEIEVPIMVLFTMSRAGALIMALNGKSRPKCIKRLQLAV